MPDKIRTLFIFEILGKPAEHIKESLEKMVEKLGEQKGIDIVRKDIREPKKAESKDKEGKTVVSEEMYSTFAEVEIETEDINLILAIVLNMLPAHVEILEPIEYKFKNFELSSFLSELTVKIHRYDEVAKVLMLERNQLLKKLEFVEQKLKEKGVDIKWEGDSGGVDDEVGDEVGGSEVDKMVKDEKEVIEDGKKEDGDGDDENKEDDEKGEIK